MQEKLDNEIGTKEAKKLEAKKVKVSSVEVTMQKDKDHNKDVGEKVILTCKHPDVEEPIKISSVMYLKNKKEVKTSGLWYKTDEDGKIAKESATVSCMNYYGCKSLKDFVGKEIQTDVDEKGYLSVKAY